MNQTEFKLLIERIVKEFSQTHHINVTDFAISELLKPAIPHLDEVNEALHEEKITIRFLEDSLRTVLRNAVDIAHNLEKDYIGYQAIQKSIEKECPYLFWC